MNAVEEERPVSELWFVPVCIIVFSIGPPLALLAVGETYFGLAAGIGNLGLLAIFMGGLWNRYLEGRGPE